MTKWLRTVFIVSVLGVSNAAAQSVKVDKDPAGDRILDEMDGLRVIESSLRKQAAAADIDWTTVSAIHVEATEFDLDPRFFDPRFDPNRRDYVDDGLSDRDRAFLSARIERSVRAKLDNFRTIVDEAGQGVVTVQPIVTFVTRSRPGLDQVARRPGLSFNSISAGEAAIRYNIRGFNGDLLATVYFRQQSNLGDGIARISEWSDATQIFDIASGYLKKSLKKAGLDRDDRES